MRLDSFLALRAILQVEDPGDLPNPGIKPRFPALQADSLLAES